MGWELIVANVGDSLAYLDTGSEVIQVSGNHRLDVNKSEQARLRSVGCEVVQSAVGARHVGPLRVWPGGLAMSRTLGDLEVSFIMHSTNACISDEVQIICRTSQPYLLALACSGALQSPLCI